MDNLIINTTIGLKEILLINLTNPSYNVSENQILWITKLIVRSIDMLIIHIQVYPNNQIEVFEIPELIGIFSKTICDKSNELHMFNLQHIIKMVSYIMDVFITNKILNVSSDIDTRKLIVNCLTLLDTNIVENIRPNTFSEQFVNTYMDFIKVLTEPLII
jgi:hypothetical protein